MKLNVMQTSASGEFINTVRVNPGLVRQHTEALLGTVNQPTNSYSHEAGHWLELDDNSLPHFIGRTIMGPPDKNSQRNVTDVDIMTLLDRVFHNIWLDNDKCEC